MRPKTFRPPPLRTQAALTMRDGRLKVEWRKWYCERGYRRRVKTFLQLSPLCVACKRVGLRTLAKIVDHIVPHKGNRLLFDDECNWQPLCKACHDQKTATEDGGFGRM